MTAHRGMIAALLGPREEEIDCDACFAALDRYVDDVVAGVDAQNEVPGMRAHLAGCPACHEEYESLHALVTNDQEGDR